MEEKLTVFLAEILAQDKEIESIHAAIAEKAETLSENPANEDLTVNLGYKLHNLYSAYEDLFKLVASFFENQIGEAPACHIGMLKRMRINIEGVRPALVSDEAFSLLDELRGFRHVFRHAYSYSLDGDRILVLTEKAAKLKPIFAVDFKRFRQALQQKDR